MTRRVHLADLAQFIGWQLLQSSRDQQVSKLTITGVQHHSFQTILGLGSEEIRLHPYEEVGLWRPQDKISHLRDRLRGSAGAKPYITVNAEELFAFDGWLAFVQTSGSPGPHLILSSETVNGEIRLLVSREELVAPADRSIEIEQQ